MSAQLYLQRAVPLFGALFNRVRYPGLATGLGVELSDSGGFAHGKGVRVGQGTRIDICASGRLQLDDGVTTGRNVHLAVGAGQCQRIGAETRIQDGCRIYGDVAIGRGCIFAPNIFISTGVHAFDVKPHLPILEQERSVPVVKRPVRILDDCWLGINVAVMPGVTIGRGCIIGSNAVVTADFALYSVAGGVPARVIRKRLDFDPSARIEAGRAEDLPYFYDGFKFATGPRDQHVAEGDFVLALHNAAAQIVRLHISGNGGEIGHGDTRKVVPSEFTIVEFRVARDASTPSFLTFRSQGAARIRWAELV
jgi:acetyltransferase-like isoleucine patch superfamily enzyme